MEGYDIKNILKGRKKNYFYKSIFFKWICNPCVRLLFLKHNFYQKKSMEKKKDTHENIRLETKILQVGKLFSNIIASR